MRLALAMTLVVVAAGTALAWDEPDAVRGLTWGASQEDLRRVAKDRGEPAPLCAAAAPHETCTHGAEIGSVRATIHYRFRDDKFVSASLGFLPTDFSLIRTIFVERYGELTKRREETVPDVEPAEGNEPGAGVGGAQDQHRTSDVRPNAQHGRR